MSTLAERSKQLGLEEEEKYWLAGAVLYVSIPPATRAFYPAHNNAQRSTGAQTVAGVLSWWLMAMVLYPEVQQRAHDELDRVVGRDRLPTFDDCDSMPYLQAMV